MELPNQIHGLCQRLVADIDKTLNSAVRQPPHVSPAQTAKPHRQQH